MDCQGYWDFHVFHCATGSHDVLSRIPVRQGRVVIDQCLFGASNSVRDSTEGHQHPDKSLPVFCGCSSRGLVVQKNPWSNHCTCKEWKQIQSKFRRHPRSVAEICNGCAPSPHIETVVVHKRAQNSPDQISAGQVTNSGTPKQNGSGTFSMDRCHQDSLRAYGQDLLNQILEQLGVTSHRVRLAGGRTFEVVAVENRGASAMDQPGSDMHVVVTGERSGTRTFQPR